MKRAYRPIRNLKGGLFYVHEWLNIYPTFLILCRSSPYLSLSLLARTVFFYRRNLPTLKTLSHKRCFYGFCTYAWRVYNYTIFHSLSERSDCFTWSVWKYLLWRKQRGNVAFSCSNWIDMLFKFPNKRSYYNDVRQHVIHYCFHVFSPCVCTATEK